MKKLMLPVIAAVLFTLGISKSTNAQAQSKALYMTYNDYVNHKPAYKEDANTQIAFHDFFGGSNVTVINGGKKMIFAKNKLFGYRDASGNDFRFVGSLAYQIVDTTGFFVYSHAQLIQQGKGARPTIVYYFSKKAEGRIIPLTFDNVSHAFHENLKFRDMLNVAAVYHEKPDAFDSGLNQYKIKELYLQSLQ